MRFLVCAQCGKRNSEFNPRCQVCDVTLPAGSVEPSSAHDRDESSIFGVSGEPEGVASSARRISHFRVLDLLGRGGMGEVYRAHDEHLDRLVALKIIRSDKWARHVGSDTVTDDRSPGGHRPSPKIRRKQRALIRRFIDEAQVTGQLDHPNIVPIYELGEADDGAAFFVMKLVEGETLTRALRNAGIERLSPERLADFLQIFIKVCEAVSFAHNRGVMHRDLKPSNIMVGEFGQVYLMDWGIALLLAGAGDDLFEDSQEISPRRTPLGSVVGTLRYMSPEQAEGRMDLLDERTDVFSLGATLYHILTGHAPNRAKTVPQMLLRAQRCDYAPPEEVVVGDGRVPPQLSRIAMKAMAKQPADRYRSVVEMQAEIKRFLRGSWHEPTRSYTAGSHIVTEGEEGDTAYIILRGRCAVIDHSGAEKVVLRDLGPGDVFGETAVFSSTRRTATVEAVDNVTVTVVNRETLTSGLGLGSWLGRFVKALADRFSEVDQRLRQFERERSGKD